MNYILKTFSCIRFMNSCTQFRYIVFQRTFFLPVRVCSFSADEGPRILFFRRYTGCFHKGKGSRVSCFLPFHDP